MATTQPNPQRQIFGTLVLGLSAIFCLAYLAGLARVAYDLVILGLLVNLPAKLIILGVVFLLGLGLGAASQRRFGHPGFALFARVFAWTCLTLLCLTYLGITFRLTTQAYSLLDYGAFFLLVLLELLTVAGLGLMISAKNLGVFAIPLLMVAAFHLVLIIYTYIFQTVPVSPYLLGDLGFLLAMSLVGTGFLGENAFRSVVEKVIEKVG